MTSTGNEVIRLGEGLACLRPELCIQRFSVVTGTTLRRSNPNTHCQRTPAHHVDHQASPLCVLHCSTLYSRRLNSCLSVQLMNAMSCKRSTANRLLEGLQELPQGANVLQIEMGNNCCVVGCSRENTASINGLLRRMCASASLDESRRKHEQHRTEQPLLQTVPTCCLPVAGGCRCAWKKGELFILLQRRILNHPFFSARRHA